MITITQMEYVLAVAKERNFRRAADSCFVTQPTLSTQIQKFEESIGAPVFDRSRTPVKPTRIGAQIIEQVKTAYNEAQRVLEIVIEESGTVQGELKVGIIPTISPYLVPLFVGALNTKHPKLDITISELTTENCLSALDQEVIDVAILATPENTKLYQQDVLYDEELLLYVNNSHPFAKRKIIKADELTPCDIWLLEEGHCLKDEIVKICKLRKAKKAKPSNLSLQVGSLEALRYLVEENHGYTLLPQLSTLKLAPSQKASLKPLCTPVPRRTIQLTKRRKVLKKAAIDALKITIQENLPEQIKNKEES